MFHCRVNFRTWEYRRSSGQEKREPEFKPTPLAPASGTSQPHVEIPKPLALDRHPHHQQSNGVLQMVCSRHSDFCIPGDAIASSSGKSTGKSQGSPFESPFETSAWDDSRTEETMPPLASSSPRGDYPASSSLNATRGSHGVNGAGAADLNGTTEGNERRVVEHRPGPPACLPGRSQPRLTVKQLIDYGRSHLMARTMPRNYYPWQLDSLFQMPLRSRHISPGCDPRALGSGTGAPRELEPSREENLLLKGEGEDWEWLSRGMPASDGQSTTGKGLGYRQALIKKGQHPLQRVLLVAVAAASAAYSKATASDASRDKEEISRLQGALKARDHALTLLRQELGHMVNCSFQQRAATSTSPTSTLAPAGPEDYPLNTPQQPQSPSASNTLHQSCPSDLCSKPRGNVSPITSPEHNNIRLASDAVDEAGASTFLAEAKPTSEETSGRDEVSDCGGRCIGPSPALEIEELSCLTDGVSGEGGEAAGGVPGQAEAQLVECRWRCAAAIRRAKEAALHVLHREAASVAAALGLVADLAQKLEQVDMSDKGDDTWQGNVFPAGFRKEEENYRQIIVSALQDAVSRAVQNVGALQQTVAATWESLGPDALAALNLESGSWMDFEAQQQQQQQGAEERCTECCCIVDGRPFEADSALKSSSDWQSGGGSNSGLESIFSATKSLNHSFTRPVTLDTNLSLNRQRMEVSPRPSNTPRDETGEDRKSDGGEEVVEKDVDTATNMETSPFASCEKLCDMSRAVDGELAQAVSEAVRKAMDSILRTAPSRNNHNPLSSSLSPLSVDASADSPETITEQLLSQLERAAAKVAGMEKEVRSLRRELHASEEKVQRLQQAVDASLDREFQSAIQNKLDLAELTKQLSLRETDDKTRQPFGGAKSREIMNLKEQCRLRDEAILELSLASNTTHESREQRLATLEEVSRGKDVTIALLKSKLAAMQDQVSAQEMENRMLRQSVASSPQAGQQTFPAFGTSASKPPTSPAKPGKEGGSARNSMNGDSPVKRMMFFRKHSDTMPAQRSDGQQADTHDIAKGTTTSTTTSTAQQRSQVSLRQALTGQIPLSALISKKLHPHHRRSFSMPNADIPRRDSSTASDDTNGTPQSSESRPNEPFDVASFQPYEHDFTADSSVSTPRTMTDQDSIMSSRDASMDFPTSPVLVEINQEINPRRASTGTIIISPPPKVRNDPKRTSLRASKEDGKRRRWMF